MNTPTEAAGVIAAALAYRDRSAVVMNKHQDQASTVLDALSRAGFSVAPLQPEWAVRYDGESVPEDVTDDRAHAEAVAAERCQSCDTCRNAFPKHVVTRSVSPWVAASREEQ